MSTGEKPVIGQAVRERLRVVADRLIPAGEGMPAASEVGVADGQLDRVLVARPDLAEPLERALEKFDAEAEIDAALGALGAADPEAHDGLLLVVAGGYYTDAEVRKRIGYDGQQPVEVRPEIIPRYVEEGLIDHMLERGPIWRRIPAQSDDGGAG